MSSDDSSSASRRGIFDYRVRLVPRPGSLAAMLASMEQSGIDGAVMSAGGVVTLDRLARHVMEGGHVEADADNDAVLEACRQADGRLVPCFFGNPHRSARHYRNRAAEFRGLELSPAVHGVPLTDERNVALVEVAAEFGHAIYVVCIGRPGCGAPDLAVLAERFPTVPFVLGHCGFVGIDVWSVDRIAPLPNVLAETSGCFTGVARATVDRLGAQRVVFGTEYPLQHPDVELAKLAALNLTPEEWRLVAGDNARRLVQGAQAMALGGTT